MSSKHAHSHWRLSAQVVATLECDVQFCPFKSSGEAAQKKHQSPEQTAAQGKKLMRRATKSIITLEHKGVLTVQIISASNLSVRPHAAYRSCQCRTDRSKNDKSMT